MAAEASLSRLPHARSRSRAELAGRLATPGKGEAANP
jgi:hypothetical protein